MRTITLIGFSTLSLFASNAMAGMLTPHEILPAVKSTSTSINYVANGGPEAETLVTYDVAGIPSFDAYNSANNVSVAFDLAAAVGAPSGTPMTVIGIGWDVNLTGIDPSWQSEIAVSFDTGDDAEEIWLRPGAGADAPGTTAFTSGGIIMLSSIPLPDVTTANGVLPMEFFESFDDAAGVVDGTWNSGSLSLLVSYDAIPEPTTLGLVALGSLVGLRRARRA